jgi:glutathione S-transferase
MDRITLHHVPFSRSFRVLWLLEELGLKADVVEYAIGDGSMAKGTLPGLSPAIRVPAVEIDGTSLSESGAIVQYLCETRGSALNRGPGHAERARFLEWIGFAETMASLVEQLNLNMVFLRPPAKPSPVVVQLNVARLKGTLAGMEARLENEWLLPGGFSGADIMMGFNLFAAPFFVKMDDFEKLNAYRERIEMRPAYQRARERDGPQRFYDQDFYPVPEH